MNITKLRGWSFYRPGRRAVGSRSRWGLHNMRAISRYIPHEIYMTADERKDTILPCGYTIAQSWAALRKSWLGFNISHCNGDWSGMSKYAYQIRKLQLQMGIQLTDFDPAILDAPVDDEDEYEEEVQEGANDIRNEEVNTPDYDKIMEEARMNLKGEHASRVGPRDEIFTKAAPNADNSDNYLRQGENHTRHSVRARVTRACVYRLRRQKQTRQSYSFAPAEDEEEQREGEEDTPKSCSYERHEQEQREGEEEEEDTPKSCSYERKKS
jgi:hypothetical protein